MSDSFVDSTRSLHVLTAVLYSRTPLSLFLSYFVLAGLIVDTFNMMLERFGLRTTSDTLIR